MRLSKAQWWVIWLAAVVILGSWWSTAESVSKGRVEADPVYQRDYKDYIDHSVNVETVSTAQGARALWTFDLDRMRQRTSEIRWEEYQRRLVPSVLLVSAFAVWLIEQRKSN